MNHLNNVFIKRVHGYIFNIYERNTPITSLNEHEHITTPCCSDISRKFM